MCGGLFFFNYFSAVGMVTIPKPGKWDEPRGSCSGTYWRMNELIASKTEIVSTCKTWKNVRVLMYMWQNHIEL